MISTTASTSTPAGSTPAGGSQSASISAPSRRVSLLRRLAGILVATAAMLIGFAVAGSASAAHADTYAGEATFTSTVECGGDELFFTVNSDEYYGSYAQLWVYDSDIEQWVTDEVWVEADVSATFNIADLTFEPGYYSVYLAYAQWNGADYDYSGEYIQQYQQYYNFDYSEASDSCYMGNDLSVDSI